MRESRYFCSISSRRCRQSQCVGRGCDREDAENRARAVHVGARGQARDPGNIEDHLAQLAESDWIVEAVVERLDVKQALYRKIDAVRRPGTAVSSNTSTIPLALLTQGLSDTFTRDFLITHFSIRRAICDCWKS